MTVQCPLCDWSYEGLHAIDHYSQHYVACSAKNPWISEAAALPAPAPQEPKPIKLTAYDKKFLRTAQIEVPAEWE